ncbi:MAG TPA: MBL fold metallo-hydrolase [Limnochordia bacterium]|nr:MBL fold metallo-hydrolase [Limnochordia bacterium]
MRLQFLGATRSVTGSSYLLETEKARVLVDCGLFQGQDAEEQANLGRPFHPHELSAVALTHAHIDHSGLLPRLVADGYPGRIWATHATADLCGVMLPDAAHIQMAEAEWQARKALRKGQKPAPPLYTTDDANQALGRFEGVDYEVPVQIADGVTATYYDAGHILGSASIALDVTEGGRTRRLVFSGDIGNKNQPILRDPAAPGPAEVVLMESTYGDRLHEAEGDHTERLGQVINATLQRKGTLIIPAFAIGRTQEVLYALDALFTAGKIPQVPVYVDSPMAVEGTEVFRRHIECYDEAARALVEKGDDPLHFASVHLVRSVEESKRLNESNESMIVIAASGMCDHGRIKHHLKHGLWREANTVLFVGFQAMGTLGRRIQDGEQQVRIFGDEIAVKAHIESMHGFSAHADRRGLLDWAGACGRPERLFLVHGELQASESLAKALKDERGLQAEIPERRAWVEL